MQVDDPSNIKTIDDMCDELRDHLKSLHHMKKLPYMCTIHFKAENDLMTMSFSQEMDVELGSDPNP